MCSGNLAQAAKDGDVDVAARLIDEGLEVDSRDTNMRTPLILSCIHNNTQASISLSSSLPTPESRRMYYFPQQGRITFPHPAMNGMTYRKT